MSEAINSLPEGDVLVVVSRFNEGVTRRLLNGAREALALHGFEESRVHVTWVPGAFEIPMALDAGLRTGRFAFAVALGAVIRGETPHFDFVAEHATRGIGGLALEHQKAIGFGLLTCDDLAQAMARAGGACGNKGTEAANTAFETAQIVYGFQSSA